MSIFATRLKELRAQESQASFASAIGVNRVQYAKYESGQNSPSVEFLERVCRAMPGVSADWLLGLRDSAAPINSIKADANSAVAVGANARASVRTVAAQPGEFPACVKCPYKKKLAKLGAILTE